MKYEVPRTYLTDKISRASPPPALEFGYKFESHAPPLTYSETKCFSCLMRLLFLGLYEGNISSATVVRRNMAGRL